MTTEAELEEIKDKFTLPSLSAMWPIISQRYKAMGFHDVLTDAQMIEEYKYVLMQYRKYVGSHEQEILKHINNLDDMLKVIEELIDKAPELDTQRKILVYNTIRDDWLTDIYNTVVSVLQAREEEDV